MKSSLLFNDFNSAFKKEFESLDSYERKLVKILQKAPPGRVHLHRHRDRISVGVVNTEDHERYHYPETILRCSDIRNQAYIDKYCAVTLLKLIRKQKYKLLGKPDEFDANLIESKLQKMEKDLRNKCPEWVCSRKRALTSWENKSFEGNPFSFCDSSSYITSKGEKVRSKTECLIADILHNEFAVPYRYEYPLTLESGRTIYPDFTLRNPITGATVYLEAFGLMNDDEYAAKAFRRILEYAENGIVQGTDLLMVFEYTDIPFSSDAFRKMIRRSILCE